MYVDETCKNQLCEIIKRQSRHPKPCKNFRDFGRCKFNPCKFKHVIFDIENDNIKSIKREHEEINTKLLAIYEKRNNLNTRKNY